MNTEYLIENARHWSLFQLRRIGWQGQLSIALLLVSVLLLVTAEISRSEIDQLTIEMEELQQKAVVSEKQEQRDSAHIARRFYAALPSQNTVNTKFANVLDSIEAHGFSVNRSDFSVRSIPQSSMVKNQIRFPLHGHYPDIRQLITTLLNTHPSLALSEINFSRDDINSDFVSSNIEFILYTKASGSQ